MKKIAFATIFKIFTLIFITYFLYLMTTIAMDIKLVVKNYENGRYLPFGNSVLDSKTGKTYISIGDRLIDVK